MEDFSNIIQVIGSLITMVILPVLLLKSKRKKAEAEADREVSDNITSYAEQWKDLYEKKEHRVMELDTKVDTLYEEINKYREAISERDARISELILKNQALEFRKCNKHGCGDREPPSEY